MLLPVEIQEMIAQSVKEPQTLLYLALACQSYKETALDALWRSVSGLEPLLQVMARGENLWDVKTSLVYDSSDDGFDPYDVVTRPSKSEFVFLRAPEERHWARFDYYATRVRHLSVVDEAAVNGAIVGRLAAQRPSKLLLPKIQSIEIHLGRCETIDDSLHYFITLGHPFVSGLNFDLRSSQFSSHEVRSFLHPWGQICPNVQRFSVTLDPSNFETPDQSIKLIGDAVSRWQNLRSLEVRGPRVTDSLIQQLGSIPGLRSLYSQVSPYTTTRPKRISFDGGRRTALLASGRFPALQTLSFENEADWHVLLPMMESTRRTLEEFILYNHHETTVSAPIFDMFFQAIGNHASLRTLKFMSRNTITPEGQPTIQMLSYLLGLRNLQIVVLSTFFVADADDVFLLGIAQAWKKLEELCLTVPISRNRRRPSESWVKMTFRGLLPILGECTKLRKMEISCRYASVDTSILQTNKVSTTMRCLTFVSSPMLGDPLAFEKQVQNLLPDAGISRMDTW